LLPLAQQATEPPFALERRLEETGDYLALADVSFEVRPGQIFVVIGLSGSGNSS
jgi:glycine betaine/proline transport system ATP-binding protein